MEVAFWYVCFANCSASRLSSWWLIDAVVINGIISLPIAVMAYFFLPDVPGVAKPNWLFSERVSVTFLQTPKDK